MIHMTPKDISNDGYLAFLRQDYGYPDLPDVELLAIDFVTQLFHQLGQSRYASLKKTRAGYRLRWEDDLEPVRGKGLESAEVIEFLFAAGWIAIVGPRVTVTVAGIARMDEQRRASGFSPFEEPWDVRIDEDRKGFLGDMYSREELERVRLLEHFEYTEKRAACTIPEYFPDETVRFFSYTLRGPLALPTPAYPRRLVEVFLSFGYLEGCGLGLRVTFEGWVWLHRTRSEAHRAFVGEEELFDWEQGVDVSVYASEFLPRLSGLALEWVDSMKENEDLGA